VRMSEHPTFRLTMNGGKYCDRMWRDSGRGSDRQQQISVFISQLHTG